MNSHFKNARMQKYVITSRLAKAGWVLFTLFALSIALPGITAYQQILQTLCLGSNCIMGQLSPVEVQLASMMIEDSMPEYARLAVVPYLLTFSLALLAAGIFIWRKPHQIAAVFAAFAFTAASTSSLAETTAYRIPALIPVAQMVHWVQLSALLPSFCLIPDNRFRPAWIRWIALALVPVTALVAFQVVSNVTGNLLNIAITTLILGTLLYRHRSLSPSSQKEQVTWALAAAALLAGAPWVGRPFHLLSFDPATTGFFAATAVGTLLVVGALACMAVAFLSDEMFRVEVVLNRALVYSLLSLFVVGVYILVVGYLSILFQSSRSLWFSLLATGLVAVLFQPVRVWVQRFVNRLLYGERAEPYEVISRFGHRLEAAIAPEDVLPTIAQIVVESLQLPYAAIALEQNDRSELAASAGAPTGETVSFPLTYQGGLVGHLLVNPRTGDSSLDAADQVLLADLAQQAGIAVHGVRLTAELQQMTEMLQQSRESLVLALEEERRRLRRDLHDDLAPTLVGLSLRAGAIADLVEADPEKARKLAENLDDGIRNTVGNIRRLVYDLRPPSLDDLGLLPAIHERAREYSSGRGVQVVVDAPESLPPLPAAVEVATYRIVQEGMLNVVKHARAETCYIGITLEDSLTIDITDDGIGLPESTTAGIGIRSIRERAEELGGSCEITNNSGRGTQILVRLPVKE